MIHFALCHPSHHQQQLGIECVRLTKRMNLLPKGSPEWVMSKMEITMITDELQFLYKEMKEDAPRTTAA